MEIDISKYHPNQIYKRKETDCILCKIRNRLIKKTPEEVIRQSFISYLIKEKGVPIEKIEVEYPLSRIKRGNKKRADILVYGDEDNTKIVLVVECKKNDWNLIDKDINQVKYYNLVLKSNCIIITNGSIHLTFKKFNDDYERIKIIPTYNNLLKNHSLKKFIVNTVPYERNTFEELKSKETHNFFIDWGHIGVDTNKKLYPFVSNLVDLFFDKKSIFEKIHFNGISIIKDLGTVWDSYSNAAGGNWSGEYKKLLIKDRRGSHQTIGIAVFGNHKFENHKTYGNTKGYTYLIVSIDDYEKSHNSLQLNIDTNIKKVNGEYQVNHSGKLTSGHSGSVKFDVVKGYIKKQAPHLLTRDGIINLGVFPANKLYLHTDKNSLDFIKNLIEYAIVRDEIRRGSR